MAGKEESCSPCDAAVSVGTALRVCKVLGNKKKCNELMKKVTNEEITPDEVFKTVRKMAKGHKRELELLNMADIFMKKSKKHVKNKHKKKKKS